jgi:uncharacterized damage-inducible protein DinB
MNEPLGNMLRYSRWATSTLLTALRNLDDATLDTGTPGTERTVRQLILHFVGGQQTFVLRTRGRQNEDELREDGPWPGFERIEAIAAESSDELVAIAEQLDEDATVALSYWGKTYLYPRSFFLVHALQHGIEHRTEIKVALNQLGIATPDLDAWQFAAAMGYGQEG